jgi:hypothetical protein
MNMIEVNENIEQLLAEEANTEKIRRKFDPLHLDRIPEIPIPDKIVVSDNIEELQKKVIKGRGRPKNPASPFDIVEVDEQTHMLNVIKPNGRPSRELNLLRKGKVAEETLYNIAKTYYYNPDWKSVALLTGHTADFLLTFSRTLKFHDLIAKIRQELDAKEQADETKIVETALTEIHDRLQHGDDILDSKTGKVIKIKPKAKELASILKTVHNVRQITRGEATSRSETISQADKLNKVAEQFARFAASRDITPVDKDEQ